MINAETDLKQKVKDLINQDRMADLAQVDRQTSAGCFMKATLQTRLALKPNEILPRERRAWRMMMDANDLGHGKSIYRPQLDYVVPAAEKLGKAFGLKPNRILLQSDIAACDLNHSNQTQIIPIQVTIPYNYPCVTVLNGHAVFEDGSLETTAELERWKKAGYEIKGIIEYSALE